MAERLEGVKLQKLAVFDGLMEANIVKSKLESFEIPCLLKYEAIGQLYGFSLDGLGKVQLLVSPDDYSRALEIVETEPEEEDEEDEDQ